MTWVGFMNSFISSTEHISSFVYITIWIFLLCKRRPSAFYKFRIKMTCSWQHWISVALDRDFLTKGHQFHFQVCAYNVLHWFVVSTHSMLCFAKQITDGVFTFTLSMTENCILKEKKSYQCCQLYVIDPQIVTREICK